MLLRKETTRIIIICFLILVGYAMGNGFMKGNFVIITLSTVSLCAGIYCIYLLEKLKEDATDSSNS